MNDHQDEPSHQSRNLLFSVPLLVGRAGCHRSWIELADSKRPGGGFFPGEGRVSTEGTRMHSSPGAHRLLRNCCLGALEPLCVPAVAQYEDGTHSL